MNLEAYVSRLRSSTPDKLFFLSKLPPEVTVFADFGCADGHLLREVHLERRETPDGWDGVYIGYDHDAAMVEAARSRRVPGQFEFTADFAMFSARIERHHRQGRKSCLILSSVVHEVLSQEPGMFLRFWLSVKSLGCHYVAIRDMAVEEGAYRKPVAKAEINAALEDEDLGHFLRHGTKEAMVFQNRAEFLEGLLKCRYEDKAREYAESYFPLTSEQWLNWTTIGSGYKLRHFEHTPLLFLQRWWAEKFGLFIPDPTHVKLLLQKEAA